MRRIRWTLVLAVGVLFTATDVPTEAGMPRLWPFRKGGPRIFRKIGRSARGAARSTASVFKSDGEEEKPDRGFTTWDRPTPGYDTAKPEKKRNFFASFFSKDDESDSSTDSDSGLSSSMQGFMASPRVDE